jgi:hypothetical protein
MTIRDTLSQEIIHLCINPFHPRNPIDFQNVINKAKNVLICCPATEGVPITSQKFNRFRDLFTRAKSTLICPGIGKEGLLEGLIDHTLFLDFSKPTLWNCFHSKTLKELSEKKWDVLFDLDARFSILSAYLCRKLHPRVCIGFQKPYSQRFFNLEYNGRPSDPYSKKLDGLFTFLGSFI